MGVMPYEDMIRTIMKGIIEAIKLALYPIFVYLDIPIEAFLILIGFMCLDTFLGALASIRMAERFVFKVLIWGFSLKVATLLLPLTVALLAKSLEYDFKILVVLTIKLLTVSEFYSCIGNMYVAKNKVRVNKIDVVSMLFKSLRTLAKKTIENTLKKIENAGDCDLKK